MNLNIPEKNPIIANFNIVLKALPTRHSAKHT